MLKRTLDCSDSEGSAGEDDEEYAKATVPSSSSSSSSSIPSAGAALLSIASSSSSPRVSGDSKARRKVKKSAKRPRNNYRLPENKRRLRAAVKEVFKEIPLDCDKSKLQMKCKAASFRYNVPVNTIRDNYLRLVKAGKECDDDDDDDDNRASENNPLSLSSTSASIIHTQHGASCPPQLPTLHWEHQEHALAYDGAFDPSTTKFVQIKPDGTIVEFPVLPAYTMRQLANVNVQPISLKPPSSSSDVISAQCSDTL